MNIEYEGFFINEPIVSTLFRDITYKHITTQFRPEKTHPHLYGCKAKFAITGYENDGDNEGLKVQLVSVENEDCAEELQELFKAIPNPHITLSVSEKGKPVNTGKLTMADPVPPYINTTIVAKFGGFNGEPVLFSQN